MKPKVLAFFTIGTEYEKLAQDLLVSVAEFALECEILAIKSRGTWEKNCAHKAEFILGALRRQPGQVFIYVDVDAKFLHYPLIADSFDGDISVHYLNGNELLSGTILIRSTPATIALCDAWATECKNDPNLWDQRALQAVIDRKQFNVQVTPLPPEYVQIFDTMAHIKDPVIQHYQASRRLKNRIVPSSATPPGVRRLLDGTFLVPRSNPDAEAALSLFCYRLANQNIWIPHSVNAGLASIRNAHKDKQCLIVGKGPSLDRLGDLVIDPTIPVIALNESIHKVEKTCGSNPLFVVQQDDALKESCQPKKESTTIVTSCKNWYASWPKRIIYDSRLWGLSQNCLSAQVAIEIARIMGCGSLYFVAFDGAISKEQHNKEYAKCIGYSATYGGSLSRFNNHKAMIIESCGDLPFTFVDMNRKTGDGPKP